MESWGSTKSYETYTKWKISLGGITLQNFFGQIFAVPEIFEIKECVKWGPGIYWPEIKNAITQDWHIQMFWNLVCDFSS